ncbi:MAG: hypothetical protein GY874_23420 [Desulfobacteraceae bacterium]|nr:hypothetical protein [Desulfobacteraceae bacterium]
MKQKKYALIVLILTLLFIQGCSTEEQISIDSDDYPEIIKDDYGGQTAIFKAIHFRDTQNGYLSADNNSYIVPREPSLRKSIFETPKLPIFHGEGYADISLKFKCRWVGALNNSNSSENEVTNFLIGIRTFDQFGDKVKYERDYFHTGLMYWTPTYINENGSINGIATTDGFIEFPIRRIKIDDIDDSISLSIMNLEAGTEVEFENVEIHTYPIISTVNN